MDMAQDNDAAKKPDDKNAAPPAGEADFGDLNDGSASPASAEDAMDFGDLFADEPAANADASGAAGRGIETAERAWRDSIAADIERAKDMMGIELQVQSAVVEALSDELREASPETVADRLRDLASKFGRLRDIQTSALEAAGAPPAEVSADDAGRLSAQRTANETALMSAVVDGKKRHVIYKPRDGRKLDFMTEDPFDQKENRMRKEWLGFQVDTLLGVDRNPVAGVNARDAEKPAGAVVEFRQGVSGEEIAWEQKLSDAEISRVADFHYLIWESDGHNGQYIVENGERLTTIDRGESFMEGQQPMRSEAVAAARERKLRANPEILRSAARYAGSERLRAAGEAAFRVAFGREEGKRRHEQFLARVARFVEHGGIPDDVKAERTPNAEETRKERAERLRRKAA